MPQVAIYPCLLAVLMALCLVTALWVALILETALLFMLILSLAFFRDPHRDVPADKNVLLAPADGKVTDINIIEEAPLLGGKAIIIGIFMSIFNVHVQRAPLAGKVEYLQHTPGSFKAAFDSAVGESNERNAIGLRGNKVRVLVVQVAGLIARRIICWCSFGAEVQQGERLGMIALGSRVDIYLPPRVKLKVEMGQRTKAGITVLGEIK